MPYNPNKHHRRSIRLKGYDYSQAGLYFITICVQDRKCLFGRIGNGEMVLNDAGNRVENEWLKIPQRFTNVQLHEYIVMPNHFHAILEIVGATLVVALNNETGGDEKGQPQGIALNNETGGDEKGQPQGVALNNERGGDEKGQPQGVALNNETGGDVKGQPQGVALNNETGGDVKGQPQGIALNNETGGDVKGQPQGIALNNETGGDEKGQPQGIALNNETGGDEKGQPQGIAPTNTKTVGDMVGAFQSIATVEYIRGVKQSGWQPFNGKLWQRNYYEHIIRDEQSYNRISDYIINNPKNWNNDKFFEQ